MTFLLGLWLRALMLRDSATKDVVLSTRLSVLHPFWSIQAFFPLRNVITFELTLKEDKCLLCKDSTDAEQYKIEIKTIALKLRMCTFETRIRER